MAEAGVSATKTKYIRSSLTSSPVETDHMKSSLPKGKVIEKTRKVKTENKQNSQKLNIIYSTSSIEDCVSLGLTNALPLVAKANSNRPSSTGSSCKKAPPVNRVDCSNRRTPTPTRQVLLEAVKRVEDRSWDMASSDAKQYSSNMTSHSVLINNLRDPAFSGCARGQIQSTTSDQSRNSETVQQSVQHASNPSSNTNRISTSDWSGDRKVVRDDEDDEDDDSDDDSEPIKAPNELFMEFLDCVMNADYVNGLKLCKMILIYEPDNSQALSFQSLIQEKITAEQNETETEEDTTDESSENSDSDEEDTGSSSSTDAEEDSILKPIKEIVSSGLQIT